MDAPRPPLAAAAAVPPAAVVGPYLAALDAHDLAGIERLVDDRLVFVTPVAPLDKREFLAFMRALFEGFPDFRFGHGPFEIDGDVATVELAMSGTHQRAFAPPMPGLRPVPATGVRVVLPRQRFHYTVASGRIVRVAGDPVPGGAILGLLQQIGVKLPPLVVMKIVARLAKWFAR